MIFEIFFFVSFRLSPGPSKCSLNNLFAESRARLYMLKTFFLTNHRLPGKSMDDYLIVVLFLSSSLLFCLRLLRRNAFFNFLSVLMIIVTFCKPFDFIRLYSLSDYISASYLLLPSDTSETFLFLLLCFFL